MNKMLVVGGGIAAIALGYAARFAYGKLFTSSQTIPKQTIINKLIQMRELLYPILFEIADIVEKRLIPKGVPPDQAKIFIMENQQLAFKSNIETILQQKIYFDIDESDLKHAIQSTYRDDKEVQFYKRAFQQEYQKCFLGIKPENLTTRILLITKDQVLKIVATLLQTKISRLKNIVSEWQGQSNELVSVEEKKQEIIKRLAESLAKNEKQDDQLRMKLLKDEKINDVKTFQFGVGKFMQQSEEFKQKYYSLQGHFKHSVQQVFNSFQ